MYGNMTLKKSVQADLYEKFVYNPEGELTSAITQGMHYNYKYNSVG